MPPVAARHRSLPRDDTGQNLPCPFIGNDQLNDSASDQRRESCVCRDFSPHDLDHMPPVAARHRSLPRDVTGQNLPGPFIGNDQLTGPETSPVTGHRSTLTGPVTGQPVTGKPVNGHRSLTGPVTGHSMTGPVTGQPVTGH
ncbi:hypothetical protein DPMN_112400 [Dreissena polymorpha]|uniref:Uncharacterized protein n=1 Tax=Dreissena polymorpha TaxID=45954 RepID=A0A9D4QQL7_DREPO|nr:hypothetical protein DPMN_112400 [Dreissena polymorpha]